MPAALKDPSALQSTANLVKFKCLNTFLDQRTDIYLGLSSPPEDLWATNHINSSDFNPSQSLQAQRSGVRLSLNSTLQLFLAAWFQIAIPDPLSMDEPIAAPSSSNLI